MPQRPQQLHGHPPEEYQAEAANIKSHAKISSYCNVILSSLTDKISESRHIK